MHSDLVGIRPDNLKLHNSRLERAKRHQEQINRKLKYETEKLGEGREQLSKNTQDLQASQDKVRDLSDRLVRSRHYNDVALADLKEKSLRIVERATENHEHEMKRQVKESE